MTIADINLETRALCDADTTSYPAATLLRRVNAAYEKIVGKIMCQDGNWQFDDTNFTDFPIGKTTLVATQKDYTFDTSHLAIEKVGVLDENGDEYFLTPLDRNDLDKPWDEYFDTDGIPEYYDKDGGSVILGPGPATGSVTMAAGLIVYFRRTADIFLETTPGTPDSATKKPGFASPFHMLICYEAAIPYCLSYKKDRVPLFEKKAMDLEKACLDFYAKREKDERNVMSNAPIKFR